MTNLAKLSHSTVISRWSWFAAREGGVVVSCIYNDSKIYIGPEVGFIVQRVLSQSEACFFLHYQHLTLSTTLPFLQHVPNLLLIQVQCPSRDDPA
jgi:hypothetical protein